MLKTIMMAAALLLLACGPSLLQRQVGMRRLSAGALAACRKDRARCAEVERCQQATLDAAKALQELQKARAAGTTDLLIEEGVSSAEVIAKELCTQAGVR